MLAPLTPRRSVNTRHTLEMTALRVCWREILFVFMATTVSDQGFFGGFKKMARQASSGVRVSARPQASLSRFSQTASFTTIFSCKAQVLTGCTALTIFGSVIPTTLMLSIPVGTIDLFSQAARAWGRSTSGDTARAAPVLIAL